MRRLPPSPCPEAIEPLKAARRFATDSALVRGLAALALTAVSYSAADGADPRRARCRYQPAGDRRGVDLPMRMRPDGRQLQSSELQLLGADARAYRHDAGARDGPRRDYRLLPQAVWREDPLRADHAGLQPARVDDALRRVAGRRRSGRSDDGALARRTALGSADTAIASAIQIRAIQTIPANQTNPIPRSASVWNANCGSVSKPCSIWPRC